MFIVSKNTALTQMRRVRAVYELPSCRRGVLEHSSIILQAFQTAVCLSTPANQGESGEDREKYRCGDRSCRGYCFRRYEHGRKKGEGLGTVGAVQVSAKKWEGRFRSMRALSHPFVESKKPLIFFASNLGRIIASVCSAYKFIIAKALSPAS